MSYALFFTGVVIGLLAVINRDNIKLLYATDVIRRARGYHF